MTMTIEELLANLDKEDREGFRIGEGLSPKRYKTPSTGLNIALGGGLGGGRIVTIHGTKSAGKSALCTQVVALAQEEGAVCAWIDAEKTFDSDWVERLGADSSKLLVSRASDMDQVGDKVAGLCRAGADVIVIDSGSALLPSSYFNKDGSMEMSNTKQIGSFSKNLKGLLRTVNYANEDALILVIMQESMVITSNAAYAKPEGGKAIEYYSSQIIRVKSNNSDNADSGDLIKGTIDHGDISLQRIIGREVHWEVVFNKLGPQGGTGDYQFYFQGPEVGIDDKLELIRLGVEYGVVRKAGAWFYLDEDTKFQGAKNFVKAMKEDEELYERLKSSVQLVL